MTCPPHKDFWEIWAAKYSAADFQREEDSRPEPEPDPVPAPASRAFTAEPAPESDVPLLETNGDATWIRVSLNVGRRHGHKSAGVRALLKRLTGLHGRAIKDLTVRDSTSLFRMDESHLEGVATNLDGNLVGEVNLSLLKIDEDGVALRVPDAEITPQAIEALLGLDTADASAETSDDEEPDTEDGAPSKIGASPADVEPARDSELAQDSEPAQDSEGSEPSQDSEDASEAVQDSNSDQGEASQDSDDSES